MDILELERRIGEWRRGDVDISVIGFSALDRPIYALHIGDASPHQQIWTAGIHAREHLTVDALCGMVEYTLAHIDSLVGGVWFVPLVNPDGANLSIHGLTERECAVATFLTEVNDGSLDFSQWKASARAVDLNCNFPASWAHGIGNLFRPSPSSYVGSSPASEPETRSLMQFTTEVAPYFTGSLHAKGREIYWEFEQDDERKERDKQLAIYVAQSTNYQLIDGTRGSAGGYKDYCITTFRIPALTLELFCDQLSHPIPIDALESEIALVERLAVDISLRER